MSHDEIRTGSSVTEPVTADTTPQVENFTITHHWDSSDSLLLQIVETVADITDQEQEEMEPLHAVLDVDALESLLSSYRSSPVCLSFSYEGCEITAANDGTVVIHPDR